MIEYLILLLLAKYRHGFARVTDTTEEDEIERILRPCAGLDYEPPPPNNVVKMRRH